jgi:hypothetical protein
MSLAAEHPLITFREGPSGRRAGLIGGPDVWEVVMWLDGLSAEVNPAAVLAEDSALTVAQIYATVSYRSAYPDEIAARVELHLRETEASEMR